MRNWRLYEDIFVFLVVCFVEEWGGWVYGLEYEGEGVGVSRNERKDV